MSHVPNARKKGKSTDDKGNTKPSGEQNRGGSSVSFSCPLTRSVRGVAISPLSLHTLPSTPMAMVHTLTLPSAAVTLCVCHAITLSSKVNACVLDADNRIIMSVERMMSAGAANPWRNARDLFLAKNTGTGDGMNGTGNSTGGLRRE